MILNITKPKNTRIGIYLKTQRGNVVVCIVEDYCHVDLNVGDTIKKINNKTVKSCKYAAKLIIKSGPFLTLEIDNNKLSTPLIC